MNVKEYQQHLSEVYTKKHMYFEDKCYVYFDNIPTTAIELVYEGSGESDWNMTKHPVLFK